MKNILVTGATGQIGSELALALRQHYGAGHIVAAGHRRQPERAFMESGPYRSFDVRDAEALQQVVHDYHIDTIYHLASLLSAVAEHTDLAAMTQDMIEKLAVQCARERGANHGTA